MFRAAPPSANFGQVVQKAREIITQDDRAAVPFPRDELARFDRRVDRRAAKAGELANVGNSKGEGFSIRAMAFCQCAGAGFLL
jgi:hypothetical protein